MNAKLRHLTEAGRFNNSAFAFFVSRLKDICVGTVCVSVHERQASMAELECSCCANINLISIIELWTSTSYARFFSLLMLNKTKFSDHKTFNSMLEHEASDAPQLDANWI